MLEGVITRLVNCTLPPLFVDIDPAQMKLELIKGHVRIQNVKLNVDEINQFILQQFHLPIRILSGTLESTEIHIPWRHLLSSPHIVDINGVHLAVTIPTRDNKLTLNQEEQLKVAITEKLEALHQLEETKLMEQDSKTSQVPTTTPGLTSLLAGVQLHIRNIHISFHSSISSLTAGLVLRDARIITCDPEGHDQGIQGASITSKCITVKDLCVYANTSVDTSILATAVAAVAASKTLLAAPTSIDGILSQPHLETLLEPISMTRQVTFSTDVSNLSNLQLKFDGKTGDSVKINLSLTQYYQLLSHAMLFQYHKKHLTSQYHGIQSKYFRHVTPFKRDTYISTYKSNRTSWITQQDISSWDREICYSDLAEMRVTALLEIEHIIPHNESWYDHILSWWHRAGGDITEEEKQVIYEAVTRDPGMIEATNIQGESVVTAFDMASSSPTPLFVACSLSCPSLLIKLSCISHPAYCDKDGLVLVDITGMGAYVAIQGASHEAATDVHIDDIKIMDIYCYDKERPPHVIMTKTESDEKNEIMLCMKMHYKDTPPSIGSTMDILCHDIIINIRPVLFLVYKQIMTYHHMTKTNDQEQDGDTKIDETRITPLPTSPLTPIMSALFPVTSNITINASIHLNDNINISCACHAHGYAHDIDMSQVDVTGEIKHVQCTSPSSSVAVLHLLNLSARYSRDHTSTSQSPPTLTYHMDAVDIMVNNTIYDNIMSMIHEMNMELPDEIKQRMKIPQEPDETHPPETKRSTSTSSSSSTSTTTPTQAIRTNILQGDHQHTQQQAGTRPVQDIRQGTKRRGFCASCWAYFRSLFGMSTEQEQPQGYQSLGSEFIIYIVLYMFSAWRSPHIVPSWTCGYIIQGRRGGK